MPGLKKISLKKLLEDDMGDYEDEKLISNIYYTSLRTSIREIEKIKISDPEEANKLIHKNNWLLDETNKAQDISVINFDLLPKRLNISGVSSPDALIINYKENELNYFIEFKDCNKSTLVNKFLNLGSSDCILKKFNDARKFILENISIEGVSTKGFVSSTHVIVVYNGKNNLISPSPMRKTKKITPYRNSRGKQTKSCYVDFTRDVKQNEVEERFGDEIKKLDFALCQEEYFPIPGELKSRKMKPVGKVKQYSIFGKYDFAKIIDDYSFFDECDWGTYTTFFGST